MIERELINPHDKEMAVRAVSESPAFPTLELSHPLEDPHPGMTLRQWMAGTIAAGIAHKFIQWSGDDVVSWDAERLATVAGDMADEVIREDAIRALEEGGEG